MADVRQEMPPQGGFSSIRWQRVLKQRPVSFAYFVLGGFISTGVMGSYFYERMFRSYKMRQIEERSAHWAMQPLVWAERDRKYVRQLRANRDAEAELMKDVPNWTVGCLYDEPVYYHVVDTLPRHNGSEMYAHTDPKYAKERAFVMMD